MARLCFFALYALILIAISDICCLGSFFVVALPLRTPSLLRTASSPSHVHSNSSRLSWVPKKQRTQLRPLSRNSRKIVSRGFARDALQKQKEIDHLSQLAKHYEATKMRSLRIHELAVQSRTIQRADPVFQQQATDELKSFDNSLLGLREILEQLGKQKGLAFYDPSNKLETLLKDAVNLSKNTAEDLATLTENIPIVGPLVNDVKCILDLLLDFLENLLDALLNPLQPLLGSLIGRVHNTA